MRTNEITFTKRTGLNASVFFPVEGNQRDGSPPCCASGGKEFSGTGGFPLSEQVRACTSSHLDAHLLQKAEHSSPSECSHHSNCLEKRTVEGNTALHYSVLHHKPESLKLLLKAKAALHTGAIFKKFFFKNSLSVIFLPSNPISYHLSYSELCRRDSLGDRTEASAHTLRRPGETILVNL